MSIAITKKEIIQIIGHFGLDNIMDDLIVNLEKAILDFNSQQTKTPLRQGFHYTEPAPGLIEWMPLYSHLNQVMIKVVGYHPVNPLVNNLPTILSMSSMYDTNTGKLIALLDGTLPTALRTGAASAVASKYLAQPDSSIFGFIGCGAQAVSQIHALSRIFKIEKVLFFDIDPEISNSFEDRCAPLKIDADFIISNIESIVEESDVLTTATTIPINQGPLFKGLQPKSHLHINAIGSDFPGKIEIPKDLLKNSFVCPDLLVQAKLEGECQQLEDHQIHEDFAGVVQNADEYRKHQNGLSVFDSTGWSLEDWVVMQMFIRYAEDLGVGQVIQLDSHTDDTKNPYAFLHLKVNVQSEET